MHMFSLHKISYFPTNNVYFQFLRLILASIYIFCILNDKLYIKLFLCFIIFILQLALIKFKNSTFVCILLILLYDFFTSTGTEYSLSLKKILFMLIAFILSILFVLLCKNVSFEINLKLFSTFYIFQFLPLFLLFVSAIKVYNKNKNIDNLIIILSLVYLLVMIISIILSYYYDMLILKCIIYIMNFLNAILLLA